MLNKQIWSHCFECVPSVEIKESWVDFSSPPFLLLKNSWYDRGTGNKIINIWSDKIAAHAIQNISKKKQYIFVYIHKNEDQIKSKFQIADSK